MGLDVQEAVDGYVAAWNEADPVVRHELLARSVTEDFEFSGPTGTFRGRDAVDGLIVALRSRMAGARVVRRGPVQAGKFAWAIVASDGVPLIEGLDEVDAGDDGRLRRVSVAAGTPSA